MMERDEMGRAKERCFEIEKEMLMSSVKLRRCRDDQREWRCLRIDKQKRGRNGGKELTASCACLRGEKRTMMTVSRIHGKGKKRESGCRGKESPEGTCGGSKGLISLRMTDRAVVAHVCYISLLCKLRVSPLHPFPARPFPYRPTICHFSSQIPIRRYGATQRGRAPSRFTCLINRRATRSGLFSFPFSPPAHT